MLNNSKYNRIPSTSTNTYHNNGSYRPIEIEMMNKNENWGSHS